MQLLADVLLIQKQSFDFFINYWDVYIIVALVVWLFTLMIKDDHIC